MTSSCALSAAKGCCHGWRAVLYTNALAFLSNGVKPMLSVQGDGDEDGEVTESTGEGGVMMGGAPRKKRKGRHYDASNDVILRLEALPPKEVKVRRQSD